jgi:hypothetical protein
MLSLQTLQSRVIMELSKVFVDISTKKLKFPMVYCLHLHTIFVKKFNFIQEQP